MSFRHRLFGATILRASDTDGGSSGSMTVDQAVAAIQAAPEAQDDTPAPVEPDNTEEAPSGAETQPGEADDTPSEADAQTADDLDAAGTPSEEDAETEAEEAPPLDAPHFWAADDKASFAELPRQLQEKVLAYEKNRDTAASKVIQETAEARKQAEAARSAADLRASELAQSKASLDKLTERAAGLFAERWPDVIDWHATLESLTVQHGGEEGLRQYVLLKEQHQAETQELQRLTDAKQESDRKAAADAKERKDNERAEFNTRETERLKTIAPELVDPVKGPPLVRGIVKFLSDNGVSQEQIQDAGAFELSIVHDAMRFREGKAAAAKVAITPKPKTSATPAGPAVRPSAAAPAQSTPQRAAEQARGRFHAKPTVDNAMAAILALSKG